MSGHEGIASRIAIEVGKILLTYVGILAGPFVLSGTTVALYSSLDPDALGDGQFRMIYVVTVPFGLLLGGLVGTAARLLCAGNRRAAGTWALEGGLITLLLAAALAIWSGFLFGPIEVVLVFGLAIVLSLAGGLMRLSAVRAEQWARFRRPLGGERASSQERDAPGVANRRASET